MRDVPTLFPLRRDFRAGRMVAVLDATSYANLAGLLAETGLPHQSLFFGEDAEFLQGEAPYAVTLDPDNRSGVKRLLQAALFRHAGFVALTDAGQDDIRRHFKSWLTVSLGQEEGLAMFRFYDTRILLAFLATLGATDARAFFGPAEALLVAGQDGVDVLDRPGLSGRARIGLSKGQIYQINDAQMEAMTRVTDEVFRGRLAEYLRRVWWEQGELLTDAELADLVDAALTDCARLGACAEGQIVWLAIVRLIRPDLVTDEAYMQSVIENHPNPNHRPSILLSAASADLSGQDRELFFVKVNYWWDYGKPGEP